MRFIFIYLFIVVVVFLARACEVNTAFCVRGVFPRLECLCWWAQLGLCSPIHSVASMHKSARGMSWTETLQQIITDLQFNGF